MIFMLLFAGLLNSYLRTYIPVPAEVKIGSEPFAYTGQSGGISEAMFIRVFKLLSEYNSRQIPDWIST